jgi:putative peptidoglycan lipid II flippase
MKQEQHVGSSPSDEGSIPWSAFKVSLGSLFGMMTRVISQMVVAWMFGAGADMDAFLTAQVVPLYLEAVLLAGLPFVFIPAFVQAQMVGDEDDAWALVGTFFWLTFGFLTVVAVAGSLLASRVIAVSAPGLSVEKADLAARMLSILMLSVPLTGLGGLTKGIQNARNRFFWPATGSAIGSVGNVLVLLLLYPAVGSVALAWGFVVSAALAACVTVLPVVRRGWSRLMPVRDAQVRELARLIAPFIIFGILTRSTSVFERYFASSLPDGDLSYLGYANRVSAMVMSLLGAGIVTAVFPAMARAYAQSGRLGLARRTEYGFRLTLAVALPALAIMSGVAAPLVAVLFERGAFDHAVTLHVSQVVPVVMVGAVVFQMVGNLISRAFYVTKDTRTVPIVAAVTSLLYILLAKTLAEAWGYVGLALAQPLHAGIAIVVLCLILVRRIGLFRVRSVAAYASACLIASIVTLVCARLLCGAVASLAPIVQLAVSGSVSAAVYISGLYAIDRDIAVSVLELTGALHIARGARILLRRVATAAFGFQFR